jgi:hypothetical protein
MTCSASNDSIVFEDACVRGLLVIRVDLGAEGLGWVRFAISPLDPAKDLLLMLAQIPRVLPAAWRARAIEALSEQRLGLLAVIAGGGPHGYAPDFLRPEPAGPQTDLDSALHAVATTPLGSVLDCDQEAVRVRSLIQIIEPRRWRPAR